MVNSSHLIWISTYQKVAPPPPPVPRKPRPSTNTCIDLRYRQAQHSSWSPEVMARYAASLSEHHSIMRPRHTHLHPPRHTAAFISSFPPFSPSIVASSSSSVPVPVPVLPHTHPHPHPVVYPRFRACCVVVQSPTTFATSRCNSSRRRNHHHDILQRPPPSLAPSFQQQTTKFHSLSTTSTTATNTNITLQLQSSSSYSSSPSSSAPSPTPRRRRRNNPDDFDKHRKARAKAEQPRRPIVARYNSIIVAEAENYQFVDGRFFFPPNSVRWHMFEKSQKFKHFNPFGRVNLYDFVLRSPRADASSSRIITRIRGAAMCFANLRGGKQSMEGYTTFWKGVELSHKPYPPPSPPPVTPSSSPSLRLDDK